MQTLNLIMKSIFLHHASYFCNATLLEKYKTFKMMKFIRIWNYTKLNELNVCKFLEEVLNTYTEFAEFNTDYRIPPHTPITLAELTEGAISNSFRGDNSLVKVLFIVSEWMIRYLLVLCGPVMKSSFHSWHIVFRQDNFYYVPKMA